MQLIETPEVRGHAQYVIVIGIMIVPWEKKRILGKKLFLHAGTHMENFFQKPCLGGYLPRHFLFLCLPQFYVVQRQPY